MADKQHATDITAREAITLFERAVKDSPQDAQAHFNLASGYYSAGNLDEAFKEFQQAAELSPALDHSHYFLGVLYARRGDKALAHQEFDKVLNGGAHALLKNQARIQIDLLGE
ncbi:MAG: tetratricopeptide repeat protein [Chloroflexi bacterium]|nr:tetratricopeptide repeat protein [Chloroflexota bacterium]